MSNNEHPAAARETSCELAAERAADLDLILRLAHAEEASDPLARCAGLVHAAVWAFHAGSFLAGEVLADAQRAVAEQRMALGCEDWRTCAWDANTSFLAELHDALVAVVVALRTRKAG